MVDMKNLIVRRATTEDALNLSVLKKQVFISTYALSGINNDFSSHITSEFSIENTENQITNSNTIVLLAEKNGFLVGCAELVLNSTCKETGNSSPELNVLYVLEQMKGKGVGYKLISESESILKAKSYPGIWLTVYHKNMAAIEFYKRQSYKDIGRYDFEMGGKFYENRIMYKGF